MRRSIVVVALGFLLGTPAGWASAQQGTADIAGRVADEQGAALPGVAIIVTNEATGVFREVDQQPRRDLPRRRSSRRAVQDCRAS